MRANIIFSNVNKEDIERAEKLGMPEPEPVESDGVIYFDKEYIHLAYLKENKEIVVYLPSGYWILEHDANLWNEIKEYLQSK